MLTHLVGQLAGVESLPHHGAGSGQDEAVCPHLGPATAQDGQVRLVPALIIIIIMVFNFTVYNSLGLGVNVLA